jgi:hypothetical protein
MVLLLHPQGTVALRIKLVETWSIHRRRFEGGNNAFSFKPHSQLRIQNYYCPKKCSQSNF